MHIPDILVKITHDFSTTVNFNLYVDISPRLRSCVLWSVAGVTDVGII